MAPRSWTVPPFEPPGLTATGVPQHPQQTAEPAHTVVRVVTSTVRAVTTTVRPSAGATETAPHQQSQNSQGSLTTTTKALISVLAVLLLCIVVAVVWSYCSRKNGRRKAAEQQHRDSASRDNNAELEDANRRRATTIVEVNGIRTPGELSVANSVYLGRYAPRLPKELEAAYFMRHQSINSEKRELDAWSLHGWTTPKF